MDITQKINIISDDDNYEDALRVVDDFIKDQCLDKKKGLHLRLLSEEAMGMVRSMTRDFDALFWIERGEGESEYKIRLQIDTIMDKSKKEALLSVSRDGNKYAKGFMGKIGDIIENGLLSFDESIRLQQRYGGNVTSYDFMGLGIMGEVPTVGGMPMVWSLQNYRDSLEDASEGDGEVKDAFDELEKSIVASLAKDVIVGVKSDRADLTIVCA